MRICYDYQIFSFQRYGGISRYFVELASRLSQFAGTDVRIVAPLYKSNLLAEKAGSVSVFGRHYLEDFAGERLVPCFDQICSRLLSTIYKPDIVHETYYSRGRTSSASARTVVTVYDTIEELFPNYFPMVEKTMELRRNVFSRAHHVICISDNTRNDLMRLYGIKPDKISVIHLASSLVSSERLPIKLNAPFFLYVGMRSLYKNFSGLIEAFAQSRLYKTHYLVCFGGGKLTNNEIDQIRGAKIPLSQIIWAQGDDALLSRYYAAAEAFICPSLYEGFGVPVLEAMGSNCPVICGNNSSLPEVAGEAALYFNAGDTVDMARAMQSLAHSAEIRFQLVGKGKDRVKRFSWDICARQTYEIYEALLS